MDLRLLREELTQNPYRTIFEEDDKKEKPKVEQTEVDWDFPSVTIITKSENSEESGSGGMTDDSAKTEVIDPESSKSSESSDSEGGESGESGESGEGGESGDGDTGDGNSSVSDNVKPGDVIQDFDTGEYGRVTSIDSNGDVEWEPVDKDELEKSGYFAKRRTDMKKVKTKFDRGDVNALAG